MSDQRRRALMSAGAAGDTRISLEAFLMREEPTGAVVLPTATELPEYAFSRCKQMTSLSAPNVTKALIYACNECQGLEHVDMPKLQVIGRRTLGTSPAVEGFAFYHCISLRNLVLPELKTVMCNYGFGYLGTTANYDLPPQGQDCGYIVLPKIETMGNYAFRKTAAAVVDLGPTLTKIGHDAFYAGRFGAVILRSPTVVAADSRDSVRSITTLYVPAAIVEDYATAAYWASDAAARTVLPIEGSEYEHAYADGTPIT